MLPTTRDHHNRARRKGRRAALQRGTALGGGPKIRNADADAADDGGGDDVGDANGGDGDGDGSANNHGTTTGTPGTPDTENSTMQSSTVCRSIASICQILESPAGYIKTSDHSTYMSPRHISGAHISR